MDLIQSMKFTKANAGIHQNVTRGTITLVRAQQIDASPVGARIRLTLVNVWKGEKKNIVNFWITLKI